MNFSRNSSIAVLVGIVAILNLTACGTTVERLAEDSITDISGDWNDTDSRWVAEAMIHDLVSTRWLSKFKREQGRIPTIIIDKVRNLSHEHINTRTFIAEIERSMINGGEVEFVASKGEREALRTEKKDQDLNASQATRKELGQETGADFMLQGDINSIIDAESKKQVRFYQVNLALINIENNKKVWVGQKKIKKSVEIGTLRW